MLSIFLWKFSRHVTFILKCSFSEVDKNIAPSLENNIKPSVLLSIFIFFVKKGLRERLLHNFIRIFSHSHKVCIAIYVQWWQCSSPAFKNCSHGVAGNFTFVCRESNNFVKLLIVDVHLNFAKTRMQIVLHMSMQWDSTISLHFL